MSLPVVSVLMMTYNHERFVAEAIESALAQDYPAELLDIVVVDDGSTDGTWAAIQPYADRINAITKPNGGVLTTANRCFAEARGEYMLLMSCDDVMYPHRVRTAVDVLRARPEVSIVTSEVDRIDEHGGSEGTYIGDLNCVPPLADDLGAILVRQTICAPAAMYRVAQVAPCFPIGPPAPWEDWWVYPHLMREGLVWRIDESLCQYRRHGDNLYNGASYLKALALRGKEIPMLRHFLTDFGDEGVPAARMASAAVIVIDAIQQIVKHGVAAREDIVAITDEDRRACGRRMDEAIRHLEAGDAESAVKAISKAIMHDPDNLAAGEIFTQADDERRRVSAITPVHTRSQVVTARWGELRRRPWLLEAFVRAFRASDDVTLAIHAAGWSTQHLQDELFPLADELGLDEHGPDVVVISHTDPVDFERPLIANPVAALTDDRYVAEWAGGPLANDVDALRDLCGAAAAAAR